MPHILIWVELATFKVGAVRNSWKDLLLQQQKCFKSKEPVFLLVCCSILFAMSQTQLMLMWSLNGIWVFIVEKATVVLVQNSFYVISLCDHHSSARKTVSCITELLPEKLLSFFDLTNLYCWCITLASAENRMRTVAVVFWFCYNKPLCA